MQTAFLKANDQKRLAKIYNRTRDMYRSSKRHIASNTFQMLPMGLFADFKFLLAVIKGQQDALQQDLSAIDLPQEVGGMDHLDQYSLQDLDNDEGSPADFGPAMREE